jgi:predicted nucleotidyltransferase
MELHARHQQALDEFLRRALEKYRDRIERIILFGSVARGEAREESDIDILIVTKEEDYRLRRALIGLAFDILLETGDDISVKALSKADFERGKNFSFLRHVLSEGVQVA